MRIMTEEKRDAWCTSDTVYENNILKAALRQLQIQLFVYDIPMKKLYFLRTAKESDQEHAAGADYSEEEFLRCRIPDAKHKIIVQEMFRKMEQGEAQAEALIRFFKEDRIIWGMLLISCCMDAAGRPVRAIGTIQETVGSEEANLRYQREREYREAMLADCRRVYEVNVTKDRFTKLESIQDSTDTGVWENYTEAMNQLRETRVYREDWDVFLEIAQREHLLQGYEAGKTEFYCEYRVVGKEGELVWSSSATHLLRDPNTGDIKGFIYIKDIDKQKKWEIELARQAECDPLTGVYNRRSAQRIIGERLEQFQDGRQWGFLMLDLDDFKYVNDTFGHAKGDRLLQKIAKQINMIVGEDDIFARLGGDEFIVFLQENAGGERVKRIADLICDSVRNTRFVRNQNFQPSASIGIAIYPECGTTFQELYEAADKALYHVKRHGKNYAAFYKSETNNV